MSPRFSISGPLGLSLAALALVALFLLFTLPSLIGAVLTSGTGSSKPAEAVDKLMAKHDDSMKNYQARFNGRSAFFKPPPKYVPPPPAPPEKEVAPPPPPPPPTVPVTYGGPSLTAIFGDEAWFKAPTNTDKPFTLKVGETEPKSGVKLLSTDSPWSVRVAHKGGEFTVGFPNAPMFDQTKSEAFFKLSPKLSLPFPGLTLVPMPVPSPSGVVESGAATNVTDDEPVDDEKSRQPEPTPGRLRARPLDGSESAPATDRENKQSKDETGEEAESDEEAQPAQSQPAQGGNPSPLPPKQTKSNHAETGTAAVASPMGTR